jgi:hypothetical protein
VCVKDQFSENAMSFQGHIENGVVVFDGPVPLPDGTRVRVEPVASAKEISEPPVADPDEEQPVSFQPAIASPGVSHPDPIRVPAKRVRIVEPMDAEEPEWSRVEYRMGLALDKFYEQEDANTDDSEGN